MGFLSRIAPPQSWRTLVVILTGCFIGLGSFILQESEAISYLGDDPQTCMNCHVMTPQYVTWKNSSHSQVTNCNDCHVPHDNVLRKYAFKGKDGLYHATMFTLHAEPEVIKMHEPGQKVVQENCIRCHMDQVTDAKLTSWTEDHVHSRTDRTCWECHREVPHGKVRSLSAVGYQLEPRTQEEIQQSIVPDWIENETKE